MTRDKNNHVSLHIELICTFRRIRVFFHIKRGGKKLNRTFENKGDMQLKKGPGFKTLIRYGISYKTKIGPNYVPRLSI